MKRAFLLVSMLLVLAPLRAEEKKPAAEKPATGPRISVEPASFDFGPALQNKTLTKEFALRNYGSQDLVIENVSTSCGCTVADGYAKLIKPGGSTPFRVTLDTKTSSGKITRKVLVRSNDPATSLFEVTVEATVSAEKAEK